MNAPGIIYVLRMIKNTNAANAIKLSTVEAFAALPELKSILHHSAIHAAVATIGIEKNIHIPNGAMAIATPRRINETITSFLLDTKKLSKNAM